MAKTPTGALTERLTILTNGPVALSAAIVRAGAVATVTTAAHGFHTGDFVTIAGAVDAAYNGEVQITVTSPTTFTYQISGTPATPATGTITAVFTSDSLGGGREGWSTLATVSAQVLPLSASEQLAAGGIAAVVLYRATIRYRADVLPSMRVNWRKFREPVPRTLEVLAVQDVAGDQRRMMTLDLGEVQQ